MKVTKEMFKNNATRISWHLLASLAHSESSFNPKAKSNVGAMGLMQFMPDTWRQWTPEGSNPYEPELSIRAADAYLGWLLDQTDNSTRSALIAYMWGIGNMMHGGVNRAPEIVQKRAREIMFASEALKAWETLE